MRKSLVTIIAILVSASALAAMFDTVSVSTMVGAGSGSYITVEPATVSFGTVMPSPTTHRFSSTTLTCEFYAANGPWSVEVSAANPTNLSGLVAQRLGQYYSIPMKFWTANYGGAGNPNDDAQWTGAGAVFRWVLDSDESFLFKLGSSAEESPSPTPFKFAIDAEGALKTNYSANVTFELVIE